MQFRFHRASFPVLSPLQRSNVSEIILWTSSTGTDVTVARWTANEQKQVDKCSGYLIRLYLIRWVQTHRDSAASHRVPFAVVPREEA